MTHISIYWGLGSSCREWFPVPWAYEKWVEKQMQLYTTVLDFLVELTNHGVRSGHERFIIKINKMCKSEKTAIDQPPDIELCFSKIISRSFYSREKKMIENDQNRSNQQIFRSSDSDS